MPSYLIRVFIFILCTYLSFNIYSLSKESLAKYPYALIGEDFGILTEDDLHTNQCIGYPSKFSQSSERSQAYPYWQCFPTSTAQIDCGENSNELPNKSDLVIFALSAIQGNQYHEYLTRRAIEYSYCRELKKTWKHLTKTQKYFCVSGEFINTKTRKNRTAFSWIFGKFKTKKGCESYFEGDCSLAYQLKQGSDCSGKSE